MANTTKLVVIKRGSALLGAMAVILAAGTYLQTVMRVDPFGPLKRTSKQIDPSLGVRLEGVSLESYDGTKLVTKANLDRVDVRQDRQHYDLIGVHDGIFYSKKGELKFDANSAEWNVSAHELNAPNARVQSKDFDLNVPRFAFSSEKGDVNIPGKVDGKVAGGKVQAIGVRLNVNDGTFKTGPIKWSGQIALTQEGGGSGKPTEWHIEGDSFEHQKNNIERYTNAVGDDIQGPNDADGIIVMADVILHDRNTDVVTATGHVRYFSSKVNMVCEKAVIERKIKKATLTGNVQMLMKAKEKQLTPSREEGIPPYRPLVPDSIAASRPQADQTGPTDEQKKLDDQIRSGKNMRDYPTICYSEKVIYYYKKGERHADISGNPQARQEFPTGGWRQVWTNSAYYDGEKETLKMDSASGATDTRLINSIGDDLVAASVTVSTKEDDEEWSGEKVKGRVMDLDNERERPQPPANVGGTVKPPATGGGTGGGQKTPPPANRAKASGLSGKIGNKKKS